MIRTPIKSHQVWKQKNSDFQIYINREKGGKWQVKVLTDKHDRYAGTHTMSPITIRKRFELIK